jgi:rhodanese-related sulfurtransferase
MTQATPEQTQAQPQQSKRVWLISTAVAVLAIIAYVVVSLTGGQSTQAGTLQNVSVQDLASAEDAFLLDVREPWEFEQGHAPGATLIPLGQLAGRIDELPDDTPIFVMCRSGNRSLTASDILIAAGKQDVRNVRGGILAWQQAQLPVVR